MTSRVVGDTTCQDGREIISAGDELGCRRDACAGVRVRGDGDLVPHEVSAVRPLDIRLRSTAACRAFHDDHRTLVHGTDSQDSLCLTVVRSCEFVASAIEDSDNRLSGGDYGLNYVHSRRTGVQVQRKEKRESESHGREIHLPANLPLERKRTARITGFKNSQEVKSEDEDSISSKERKSSIGKACFHGTDSERHESQISCLVICIWPHVLSLLPDCDLFL